MRNFIRKWGHAVQHDHHMKPIIPPKYQIGIRVENCNLQLLQALEPWCDRIYADTDWQSYIISEQPNTIMNLEKRCHSLTKLDKNDYDGILVNVNGNMFTQQDFQFIQQLPEIIANDEKLEQGAFQLGSMKIEISNIKKQTI